MDCRECKKFISEFLDGELDDEKQAVMNQHLSSCAKCAQDLEKLNKMVNIMKTMGKVDPPPDFIEKVNRRLDTPGFWQYIYKGLGMIWSLKFQTLALALVATLVIAVVITTHTKKEIMPLHDQIAPETIKNLLDTSELSQEPKKTQVALREENRQIKKKFDAKDISPTECIDGICLFDEDKELEKSFEELAVKADAQMLAKRKRAVYADAEVSNALEDMTVGAKDKQKWQLESGDQETTEQSIQSLLNEFDAIIVKDDMLNVENKSVVFKVKFSQLSVILTRFKQLGTVTVLTAMPEFPASAPIGMQGHINTKILEKEILVELTIILNN